MRIKSLLLGSAAAGMVAVSGAQAADVVVYTEPAAEYVRICDVYGAGFFYIPGTETCLQISGYVWYQLGADSYDSGDTPSYHFGTAGRDGWYKNSRARVNFDARSATEWGTLRGYIRLQAAWEAVGVANDGNVVADQAFLELGGLRMGYTESAWVTSQSSGVASFGSHSWTGMFYGYQQRQLISYTFTGGEGFHATLSLENDTVYGSGGGTGIGRGYLPDIVGVIGVNQAWGGAWLKAGWDESRNAAEDSQFGVQAGLQVNVPNAPGSSLRLIGYYASADGQFGPGHPLGTQSRWSLLGSYQHRFNPQLAASVAAQYFSNRYAAFTNTQVSGTSAWAAEASVVWTPVTNFEVRGEYGFTKARGHDASHSGWLRFTRYF